jgi:PKD repeat protein
MEVRPWPYLVAPVFAAAVLAVAACGSPKTAPTPTASETPSSSSVKAVLRVVSDVQPALGVAGFTPFVFDATGSTGQGLTYRISFGDGEETTAASATHVVRASGSKTAKLTVTDSAGASSSVEVPYFMVPVGGTAPTIWTATSPSGAATGLTLAQSGDRIDGTYYEGGPQALSRTVTGQLFGARAVTFRSSGDLSFFVGQFEWAPGTAANCLSLTCVEFFANAQAGAFSGRTVEFRPVADVLPVARLSIPSETSPAIGVCNYRPIEVDASASSGNSLSYAMSYDGGTILGPKGSFVPEQPIRSSVRLTVIDAFGRQNSTDVPYAVQTLATGSSKIWLKSVLPLGNEWFSMTLQEVSSGHFTGSYFEELQGKGSTGQRFNVTAEVSDRQHVVIRTTDGSITFEGAMDWPDASPSYCNGAAACLPPGLRLAKRGGIGSGRTYFLERTTQSDFSPVDRCR